MNNLEKQAAAARLIRAIKRPTPIAKHVRNFSKVGPERNWLISPLDGLQKQFGNSQSALRHQEIYGTNPLERNLAQQNSMAMHRLRKEIVDRYKDTPYIANSLDTRNIR